MFPLPCATDSVNPNKSKFYKVNCLNATCHSLAKTLIQSLLQVMFFLTMVFQAQEALTTLPLANTDAAQLNLHYLHSGQRRSPNTCSSLWIVFSFSAETSQLETSWPSVSADHSARLWGSTSLKWQRLQAPRSSSRSFRCFDYEQEGYILVSLSNKDNIV